MKRIATALLAFGLPAAALAQPVVDGTCSDAQYVTTAAVDNSVVNDGFGPTNNLIALRYYADGTNVYLCAVGQAEANGNGMAFFLNFSDYDGFPGGTALPADGPGFFGTIKGTKMPSAMNVDWIFFFNRANTNKVYTNVARLGTDAFISNPNGDYLGEATDDAGPISFNGNIVSEGGSGTGQIAYNSQGAANTGYEIMIPLSAFTGVSPAPSGGASAQNTQAGAQLSTFAIIASSSGYFSNEMLPDNNLNGSADGASNFGNAPDLSAATTTAPQALPVELVNFAAQASGTSARLSWTTASETNNAGFAIEQQTGNAWTERGFVAGRGTTTERHTYAFDVTGLTAGTHAFRLRQTDTDGTVHYSSVATVEIGVDGGSRVTLLGSRAVRVETSEAEAVSVRLFDVLGRMVSEQRAEVSGTVEFAVPSGLSSGAYVVRVEGERFAATRTLVVR